MRLIVDNILQHSSFYLFLHTSTRIIAHERASKKKKILLLFFLLLLRLLTEKRRKGRKKKRARKNNSIADWSRVTVHIKSNYKCSLASSLVLSFSFCEQQPLFFSFFSLYLSRSLSLSLIVFLFLFLIFFFFSSVHRKERKCEKVRRLRSRIKIDIQKSIKSYTSITSHIPIKFDRYKTYPLHASSRQARRK